MDMIYVPARSVTHVKRASGSDLTLTADAAAVAGCLDALGTLTD